MMMKTNKIHLLLLRSHLSITSNGGTKQTAPAAITAPAKICACKKLPAATSARAPAIGAPITDPTAAALQLMPIRAPMTLMVGDRVGCGMVEVGAVTRTPDTNPHSTHQTIKAAELCTAIQAKMSVAPRLAANRSV